MDSLSEIGRLMRLRTLELNPNCVCAKCNPNYAGMIVCGTCGCKRCPHAADHDFVCTGSNESGQTPERTIDAMNTINKNTTQHLFDTPQYFGEDGEFLAVRGDISQAEAFDRLFSFEQSEGGYEPEFKAENLFASKAYRRGPESEVESWFLNWSDAEITSAYDGVADVWVVQLH